MDRSVKVGIGIAGGEFARYAITYASLMGVRKPPDSIYIQTRGANIAENRNKIAEQALELGCTHLWYTDDDQVFSPDTLLKLLERDKDIVSGLYLNREHPFTPQMYDWEDDKGYVKPQLLKPFTGGLQKVVTTGAGCFLVRTDVLRKMERPWWRLGQLEPSGWCDDVDFCRRARETGFDIWCDTDVPVGHNLWVTVWPQKQENGEWMSMLIGANGVPLCGFPAAAQKSTLVSA